MVSQILTLRSDVQQEYSNAILSLRFHPGDFMILFEMEMLRAHWRSHEKDSNVSECLSLPSGGGIWLSLCIAVFAGGVHSKFEKETLRIHCTVVMPTSGCGHAVPLVSHCFA